MRSVLMFASPGDRAASPPRSRARFAGRTRLGERHEEGRALAEFRLGSDGPAMALDDAADDRQAHPLAAGDVRVQPAKRLEELGQVARRDPQAVVANEVRWSVCG